MDSTFRRRFLVVSIAVTAAVAGGVILAQHQAANRHATEKASAVQPDSSPPQPREAAAVAGRHPISVNSPDGPPRIGTGLVDSLGREITVSCASCHAHFEPNPDVAAGDQLTQFHQGLNFHHGQLACGSCHHPDDYNALRLADGRPLAYADVQLLCAQCHAPQARDFEHGAHGGMSGYWDLSRGPRQRKNCIDCHDPHAPAYPAMTPKFQPFDRFLAPPQEAHDDRD